MLFNFIIQVLFKCCELESLKIHKFDTCEGNTKTPILVSRNITKTFIKQTNCALMPPPEHRNHSNTILNYRKSERMQIIYFDTFDDRPKVIKYCCMTHY